MTLNEIWTVAINKSEKEMITKLQGLLLHKDGRAMAYGEVVVAACKEMTERIEKENAAKPEESRPVIKQMTPVPLQVIRQEDVGNAESPVLYQLGGPAEGKPINPVMPATIKKAPVKQVMSVRDHAWICSKTKCGHPNAANTTACSKCGTPRKG